MIRWLFSIFARVNMVTPRSRVALFLVMLGLFITFSLFFDISKLLLIPSFLHKYGEIDGVLTLIVPILIYSNGETDKSKIINDNKGKTGIYQWTHRKSNKKYIGSAIDLSRRLRDYYSFSALKRVNNIISRAIIFHTHSAFSLTILEYIDISNLSQEKSRKLILEREQHYIDIFLPEYNILKFAGSPLGFIHSAETLALMSEVQRSIDRTGEKNPRGMLGKTHSVETLALMSEAKLGKNNPNFGLTLSAETKEKISLALSGENNPMFGKTQTEGSKALMSLAMIGENNPMFGKFHSTETKAKISLALGKTIFVYDTNGSLINKFSSANKAAKSFHCNHNTIISYAKTGKVYKEKWIFSMIEHPVS